MSPVELLIVSLAGAGLGLVGLLALALIAPLLDLFSRRKEGVPRRAVLRYYPPHLRHHIDWSAVQLVAPKVAAVTGVVTAGVAIFAVGLIEVFG